MNTGPGSPQTEWRTLRFETIDSTSEEARRRALGGDPGPLWVIAEAQTAGRGRRGRSWASPRGNLYASALIVDPCETAQAAELGFVAGVALAEAARAHGAPARLKWPNDLLIGGGKCAGLLVDGLHVPGRGLACVVGIGVNCAEAPEGVGYPTAALVDGEGRPVAAEALFGTLRLRFAAALSLWRRGRNFTAIREAWLAHAGPIGERIRVSGPSGRQEGTFGGLDLHGRLLFRGEQEIEPIETADLWILPPSDGAPDAECSATVGEGRS